MSVIWFGAPFSFMDHLSSPSATVDWTGEGLSECRYFVERKLAEGGMGAIYLAQDQKLDIQVVIKTPHAELLKDSDFAARFTREIGSLKQLSHPHILKVLDVGKHRDIPFVVLPFLAGGSLRDRQQHAVDGSGTPMPPESLRTWLFEVADALDFMHMRGYLHRDIKPDNLLFDAIGQVYLGDFGVAKVISDHRPEAQRTVMTEAGTTIGTPQYMAPELILAKKFDQRVDQYALAVTVYELLSGRYPFEGSNPTAIFVEQVKTTPPALHTLAADIPVKLSAAVEKALSKEPKNRFPTCLAFANALLATLPEAPAFVVQEPQEPSIHSNETLSMPVNAPLIAEGKKGQPPAIHVPNAFGRKAASTEKEANSTAASSKPSPKQKAGTARTRDQQSASKAQSRLGSYVSNVPIWAWLVGSVAGALMLTICAGAVGVILSNRATPPRENLANSNGPRPDRPDPKNVILPPTDQENKQKQKPFDGGQNVKNLDPIPPHFFRRYKPLGYCGSTPSTTYSRAGAREW